MPRDDQGIFRLWISQNGDDANSGELPETPKRTLSSVRPLVEPNTIVTIGPGVYDEPLVPSGVADGTVTYRGDNRWKKPVICPSGESERPLLIVEQNITIDNLCLNGSMSKSDCVKITYTSTGQFARHVKLINCEIQEAWNQGVLITGNAQGVRDVSLIDCTIVDSGRNKDQLWNQLHGVYVKVDDVWVTSCVIRECAAYGIVVYGGEPEHRPNRCVVKDTFVEEYGSRGSPHVSGVAMYHGTGHVIENVVATTRYRTKRKIDIQAPTVIL